MIVNVLFANHPSASSANLQRLCVFPSTWPCTLVMFCCPAGIMETHTLHVMGVNEGNVERC
jgi:hypothetical protein